VEKMYCDLFSGFSKLLNIRGARLALGLFTKRFFLIFLLLLAIM
jgi:hypothetical protein